MELEEWYIQFLKARDVFEKKIKDIIKKDSVTEVHFTDKILKILIKPTLDEIKKYDKKEYLTILFPNKKEHVEFLIKNWNSLKEYPNLSIFFINPESSLDKKWALKPHIHDKITDPEALKPGLLAMFETVEESK